MLRCEDVVLEIAKFLCLYEQAHTLGLTCVRVARVVWCHSKILLDSRELNARPDCMRHAASAADVGHLICLRYLHANRKALAKCGYPIVIPKSFHYSRKTVCLNAITNNHFDCFRYAFENGYPCDEGEMMMMANLGRLQFLQFAHEQGAPWCEATCCEAAINGHLDCLQYAHENGCPFDCCEIMECAISADQVDCLDYVIENCDSIDLKEAFTMATENVSVACLRYLREHYTVDLSCT